MSIPGDHSYQQTIDYLYALQKHGVKLGLANSTALMAIAGNPHTKFRTVHVAGTNGKGSTSAFLASMLAHAGFRVGLYTSPHLVSFTERIRINGVAVTEQDVVELARSLRQGYEGLSSPGKEPLNPTFFELTTAMAFSYFARQAVDIAVVEVGMGGRLDSTNVITPLVSVITNIDLEHTEFLGDTLELIAAEKAGIIKPGVPVVTGASQPPVVNVIEREARTQGAPVYRLGRDFTPGAVSGGDGQAFDYRGIRHAYRQLRINLKGRYQIENACLALAAVECLGGAGIAIGEPAVRSGLEQARWEGRLECAAREPDIYLDGAHNPASAKMLARAVSEMKTRYRRLVLVIGILGDKDIRGILSELLPLADRVIVTRPEYSRAMDIGLLTAEVRRLHPDVTSSETVARALQQAREEAGPEDLVLVTGSLYVIGDARAALFPASETSPGLSNLRG